MNFAKKILLGAFLICPSIASAFTISAEITGDLIDTSIHLSHPAIEAGPGGPYIDVGDAFSFSFDFDASAAPVSQTLYPSGQVNSVWNGSKGTLNVGGVTTSVNMSLHTDFFRTAGTPNSYNFSSYILMEKTVQSGPQAGGFDVIAPFFFERSTLTGDPLSFSPLSVVNGPNGLPPLASPVFPMEVSESFVNVYCTVCMPSDYVSFDFGLGNLSLVETGRSTPQSPAPVPLPASVLLLVAGLTGLGTLGARRKTA